MQGRVVLVTGGARGAARAAPVEGRRDRQHGIDRPEKSHRNMAACCGSKFAAIGITQALAVELAPENIRVNAICPGMVGTAMWLEHLMPMNTLDAAAKTAEFERAMHATIPLGRPQTAQDIGAAAVFLASAPNVTGVSLSVAGGFEMN